MKNIEDQFGEGWCEVCGKDESICICPQCPVCEEYGNPKCYTDHGMTLTTEQITSKTEVEKSQKEQEERDRQEAAYWSDSARIKEDQEAKNYFARNNHSGERNE
jgi:hypothetical protein